jgi:prepilin-type N-terminal cleavage/methylation domain-containing protein
MGAAMIETRRTWTSRQVSNQSGFTMLEVVVSMVVLTIGLLSMLSLFSLAVASTHTAQEDMIAKQEANEALENIFTARNSSQTPWSQIKNVADGGIFMDGYQPTFDPGPDGLDGTADDLNGSVADSNCPGPSQCVRQAGPDGVLGTADDTWLPLNNFEREIVITPVCNPACSVDGPLRQIMVNIRYTGGQNIRFKKVYSISTYISQYR